MLSGGGLVKVAFCTHMYLTHHCVSSITPSSCLGPLGHHLTHNFIFWGFLQICLISCESIHSYKGYHRFIWHFLSPVTCNSWHSCNSEPPPCCSPWIVKFIPVINNVVCYYLQTALSLIQSQLGASAACHSLLSRLCCLLMAKCPKNSF